MSNGNSKHGAALAEVLKERRREAQEETEYLIAQLRDADELEETRPTVPNIVVNVDAPRRSLWDSLRPRKHRSDSSVPPSHQPKGLNPAKLTIISGIVATVVTAIIAALRATGILH